MNGNTNNAPRFLFHADALGLAADIQRPKNSSLDSVASSVLAITGGHAHAQAPRDAGDTEDAGMICYGFAETDVYGGYEPPEDAVRVTQGNFSDTDLFTRTAVRSTVTGFKLYREPASGPDWSGRRAAAISAERLEAMLESTSDCRGESEFRTLQAFFRGVMVYGRELIVETNTRLFTNNYTKEKLDCALRDQQFRQRCSNQIFEHGSGLIAGTVVNELRWAHGEQPDNAKIEGNTLLIYGLGSFYFGEIFIMEGFRRLTLIRFQLGSPDGSRDAAAVRERAQVEEAGGSSGDDQNSAVGSGTVVQASSNGQTSPPQTGH